MNRAKEEGYAGVVHIEPLPLYRKLMRHIGNIGHTKDKYL
jgi:hypothetical protein